MPSIVIYTDPHLGVRRGAHTTPLTSARLQRTCLLTTLELLHKNKADRYFCLGDMFHEYSNPEEIIREALPVMQATDLVLSGNHDLVNREMKVGSLQLLSEVYPNKVLIANWGQVDHFLFDEGLTRFTFIPHLSSQELFEQALEEAPRQVRPNAWNVLCLHCNYNRSYEDMSDATLNLTSDRAEQLLSHFHRILLGHEHTPTAYHGGKVLVVGNVHPTGFGDISPKRALRYDTESGEFNSIHVTGLDKTHLRLKASQLPQNPADIEVEFLDVFDDLEPGKANKLVTQIFAQAPNICGVRLSGEEQDLEARNVDKKALDNLPGFIAKDLEKKDKGLHELWVELSKGDTA